MLPPHACITASIGRDIELIKFIIAWSSKILHSSSRKRINSIKVGGATKRALTCLSIITQTCSIGFVSWFPGGQFYSVDTGINMVFCNNPFFLSPMNSPKITTCSWIIPSMYLCEFIASLLINTRSVRRFSEINFYAISNHHWMITLNYVALRLSFASSSLNYMLTIWS